jgi:rhodanese-related sulfurtransferase
MSSEPSLRGGVAIIVIGGAVLGLLYNGVGLATRPPRGIAWITKEEALPSLEDIADTTRMAPATPAPDASAPSPMATPAPPLSSGSRTAQPGRESPKRESPPPAAGGAPATGGTSGAATGTAPPAASSVPEPRATAPLPFVPDSDKPIQVQVSMVKRFFDARGALFLDARDPAEYDKGHIPGAIRLTNPEAQSEPDRLKALPVNGRPTIVYCEGGACEASLDLARFLIESGFKKVMVYMGGYPEWEAAMYPVTRGSAP